MELLTSFKGILALVFFAAGVISVLKRPKTGIGIIIFLVVLKEGFLIDWFPSIYEMHMPQTFFILTFVSWFIHSGKYPLRLNRDIFLMFLFFTIICYSRHHFGTAIFENKVPTEFFRETIFFFLVIQLLRQPRDIKNILWLIVGFHLFLALRAYYFYKAYSMPIALPGFNEDLNPNGFANALAFVFPIAYLLATRTKNKMLKILGLFTVLWCPIGVILTYSREGVIALLSGVGALVFFEKKKSRLILAVLILAVLIIPHLSEKYIGRVKSIQEYQEDISAMGRVATNHAALNMLKKYPFFGVGAGNYNDVFINFVPEEELKWVEPGKSVHNVILQAASETGFIGLTIFLLLLLRGFKNTFRKKGNKDGEIEEYDFALMLRIALFVKLISLQFGQGAYFGDLYLLLPLISAVKMLGSYSEATPNPAIRKR